MGRRVNISPDMPERRRKSAIETLNTHERIVRLEERSETTGENIDTILSNHLPHIQAAVDEGKRSASEAVENLRKETRDNLNGLGDRIDKTIKEFAERIETRQDKNDAKNWWIICLLISTLVTIIVSGLRAHYGV